MEIAFFFGGMTRTASDQSKSSLQSGSSLIEASISASVSASRAAQSVLPRRGSSREIRVIFSSFSAIGPPRRDEPADFTADRAGNRDFPPFEVSENLISDFTMAIRSTDGRYVLYRRSS